MESQKVQIHCKKMQFLMLRNRKKTAKAGSPCIVLMQKWLLKIVCFSCMILYRKNLINPFLREMKDVLTQLLLLCHYIREIRVEFQASVACCSRHSTTRYFSHLFTPIKCDCHAAPFQHQLFSFKLPQDLMKRR